MTTIIAGRFQEQSEVDDAVAELERKGFASDRIASFYVNPAGQHDRYKLGGDEAMSPGAKESDRGAAMGVATGAAAGIAATAILGPLGALTGGLVGAYVGGLIGGLSKMKDQGQVGPHGEDAENALPVRHAGLMVAVAVEPDQADGAIELLQDFGATDIERTEGHISDRNWEDFDPVMPPRLIGNLPSRTAASAPSQHVDRGY